MQKQPQPPDPICRNSSYIAIKHTSFKLDRQTKWKSPKTCPPTHPTINNSGLVDINYLSTTLERSETYSQDIRESAGETLCRAKIFSHPVQGIKGFISTKALCDCWTSGRTLTLCSCPQQLHYSCGLVWTDSKKMVWILKMSALPFNSLA